MELNLPMQPRLIQANSEVKQLAGMTAIASGPIIYCIEACDNTDIEAIKLNEKTSLTYSFDPSMLNGVNVIKSNGNEKITAIPYYALGNREAGSGYKVWIPKE